MLYPPSMNTTFSIINIRGMLSSCGEDTAVTPQSDTPLTHTSKREMNIGTVPNKKTTHALQPSTSTNALSRRSTAPPRACTRRHHRRSATRANKFKRKNCRTWLRKSNAENAPSEWVQRMNVLWNSTGCLTSWQNLLQCASESTHECWACGRAHHPKSPGYTHG